MVDFPSPKFKTDTEIEQWRDILTEIYTYLCVTDDGIRSALVHSGPRPFTTAFHSDSQVAMGTGYWHSHPPALSD